MRGWRRASSAACSKSRPSCIPPRKRRSFPRRLCRPHAHFHVFCILFRNRGTSRERFSRTRPSVLNWPKRAGQALRKPRSFDTHFSRRPLSLCRLGRKAGDSGSCRHRQMRRNALPHRSTRRGRAHVDAPQPPKPYPSPLPKMRRRSQRQERPCGSWNSPYIAVHEVTVSADLRACLIYF